MASVDVGQDFVDTDVTGRAYSVILASILCPSIALLFVAGRLFVRICITKALRFDDYLAVLTLFSNIAYAVLQGLATQPYIGIDRQQDSFQPSEESQYYKWVFMFDTFYITSLLGYKLTILFLYIRVFGVRKHFRWTCFAVVFVIAGYLIAVLVAQLAGCNPPHKFWDIYGQGSCIDFKRFGVAYGCLNIVTDFMLIVLPLREIWRLFVPLREKAWASMIFVSAILAFGTAIVSQVYRLHDLFSADRTYDAGITFVWQTIEINTGLICSCTPTLRPIYRKTLDTLIATFQSGGSTSATEVERHNRETGKYGNSIDSTSSPSPDGLRTGPHDSGAEKAAAANIGLALSSVPASDLEAYQPRRVPSDVYMSPLPSMTEQERERTRRADDLAQAAAGTFPEFDEEAGRGRSTGEKKRYSQAELELILRQANFARARLEREAEKSRERTEERDGTEGMCDDEGHGLSHHHVRETEGAKKARRKKSCDLEKGIGLRI